MSAASAKSKERDKRAKLMKQLGLEVNEIVKGAFSTAASGRIRKSEYQMFWEQVQDEKRQATVFLNEVLDRLLTMLEKSSNPFGVPLESVTNTVAFINLFLDVIPTDVRLKKFLDGWKKKEKEPEFGRKFPYVKEVVRTLAQKVEKEDIVGPLIVGCSTLHSVDEYQRFADISQYPSVDSYDNRPGDGVFIYPYLKKLCLDSREQYKVVLQSIVAKMMTLPQQMKMNPKVAETTLLAQLHLLRNLLSIGPISTQDRPWLQRAILTVQQFYLWPSPYGNVARDVLQLLHRELLVPGTAMRQRLISECKKGYLRGFTAEDGQEGRPVYFWVDGDDKKALSYPLTMNMIDLEEKSEKKKSKADANTASVSHNAKAILLCSMLRSADVKLEVDDIESIKALPDADLNQLFDKAVTAVDAIPNATKAEVAAEIRFKTLADIRQQMKTAATAAKEAKKAPGRITKLAEPFDASLPPIVPFFISAKIGYQIPNKEQVSLMCLTTIPFPTTPMLETFKNLVSEHEPTRFDQKSTELRFVILGGDKTLHNFLCAYLQMKLFEEEMIKNTQIKFYLMPASSKPNHVAAFLARHDSWYNRHVYLPFRSGTFILPWLNVDEETFADESQDLPPPGVFYRRLVEDYTREAEAAYGFNVYKIEGWRESTKGAAGATDAKGLPPDLHDTLIPFIQRVEIGVSATAELAREKKTKVIPENAKVDDLLKDKNLAFSPVDLKVKFTQVDMSGKVVQTVDDDAAQYAQILISNIPRTGDKCFPPDPTAPCLEMYGQSFKPIKSKAELKRNVLLTEARQHSNCIEICSTSENTKFDLLADGSLFQGFHRIRITPHVDDKTKKQITFPIQTFFPFSL